MTRHVFLTAAVRTLANESHGLLISYESVEYKPNFAIYKINLLSKQSYISVCIISIDQMLSKLIHIHLDCQIDQLHFKNRSFLDQHLFYLSSLFIRQKETIY